MWRLMGLLAFVPVMAGLNLQMCDVPHRYMSGEASILYWTTLNGTFPYATAWPTLDTSEGRGITETLQPDYAIGFCVGGRFFWPLSHNHVEVNLSSVVVKGNGAVASPGLILSGSQQLSGGFARADSRQHYIGGDLSYSICVYDVGCLRSAIFGGAGYTRVTDELTIVNDGGTITDLFTRSKFEGLGPRFGFSALGRLPYGLCVDGRLAIRTPVGRRGLSRRDGATAARGQDVILVGGFDGRLSAALQMLHCCILYRAEVGYEMVYFFQTMNRRDLQGVGFGQYHAGRDIGFAGPYASFSVAF